MALINEAFLRLCREPPIRVFAREVLRRMNVSLDTKVQWGLGRRPQYLFGTHRAALQAKAEGVSEIVVAEFGVAGGNGLIALQDHAWEVEAATGVGIRVYGFDTGRGLPEFCGDHRDHPDNWVPADYQMDEAALRARLDDRTELILGDIRDTVPEFLERQPAPLGFASIDVDLYSSASAALRLLSHPQRKLLRRTVLYFDDVELDVSHQYAGELLAIREFNERCPEVKIDVMRGIRAERAFPEAPWLANMYVAHDLERISAAQHDRRPQVDGGCALRD